MINNNCIHVFSFRKISSNFRFRNYSIPRFCHKGVIVKRFTPRAMGRATAKNNVLTHVELVAKEV